MYGADVALVQGKIRVLGVVLQLYSMFFLREEASFIKLHYCRAVLND